MKNSLLILLYITIISFAFGQLGRMTFGDGLVVQMSDVLVGFTFLFWSISHRTVLKETILTHQYTKPAIFFIIIGVLSLLFHVPDLSLDEFFISLLYPLRWILYFGLFFVVRSYSPQQKKHILLSLVVTSLLFIIFGYVQYFFYPNLRNIYYLGWDDHLFRLTSTFFDPNFAAACISLLCFSISIFFFSYFHTIQNKLFLGGLYIFAFISLLLTYSRSGFVMFAIGTIISFFLLNKKRLILVILGCLAFGIFLIPKNLGSSGVELWRTASIFARTEAAKQAINIFFDHPLFGIGFNAYRYVQREYGFADDSNWQVSHSGAGTDNSFLFVLATTGLVGFGAFVYLWYTLISKTYMTYKSTKTNNFKKMLSILILSSVAGLFVDSLFINALFFPYILLWLWVVLGTQ
jgi:putative inorganic carbon (hco3(-)) transporter